ncbi:MAG: bacillithiol biosynthesis deacetylase BshB1 [Bacteroidota bacterium]
MRLVYREITDVDILAIGIHPDDIELGAGGTVLSHIAQGYRLGLCDLTQGELGTRGDAPTRLKESAAAAESMGVDWRVNLEMRDGFSKVDEDHILSIAEIIRQCRPKILIANSVHDRHPDHARGATLVREAHFFAGLKKITSLSEKAHRADVLYHYVQDEYIQPDFCVDVSPYVSGKFEAITTYTTQFYQGEEDGDQTAISGKRFLEFLDGRMRDFGRSIGVSHAEGFTAHRNIGVASISDLI